MEMLSTDKRQVITVASPQLVLPCGMEVQVGGIQVEYSSNIHPLERGQTLTDHHLSQLVKRKRDIYTVHLTDILLR